MNNNKFVYDKCDMHKNMICIKKNKEINLIMIRRHANNLD